MRKNKIVLTLMITKFEDLTHENISELTGFEPDFQLVKGQRKNPKNENSPLLQTNAWGLESGLNPHEDFDKHLDALLSKIEANYNAFKTLSSKYSCYIACGLFVYYGNGESTPWVHLDDRYNAIAKDLNLDFDVDLYVRRANL